VLDRPTRLTLFWSLTIVLYGYLARSPGWVLYLHFVFSLLTGNEFLSVSLSIRDIKKIDINGRCRQPTGGTTYQSNAIEISHLYVSWTTALLNGRMDTDNATVRGRSILAYIAYTKNVYIKMIFTKYYERVQIKADETGRTFSMH
jgi:hypothetical protein